MYDKKNTVTEQYTYDGTNRMVKGVNEKGEQSHYIYNGLGYLVGNEWIIEKNAYGYNGVNTTPSAQVEGVVVCDRHSNVTGNGHINPTGKGHTTGGTTGGSTPTVNNKQAVVHKDYVLDYTSPLKDVIMETESGTGGLTYRFTYGLEKNNAVIYGIPNGVGSVMQSYTYPNGTANVVKLYYHHDRLGSTDYLTDNVAGKPTSYTEYDDWGAMVMKPILQLGARELDLVSEYTGHPYDQVLGLYFAEARMYDATDRRFVSVDPVKGSIVNAATMVQYTYVLDNSVKFVDWFGLEKLIISGGAYNENPGKVYQYEFIDTALLQIKMIREMSDESILWTVADAGWSDQQKKDIKEAGKMYPNVKVVIFSNAESLIELINNGADNNRANDPITATFVFSHGKPGKIMLGYHHNDVAADLEFTADMIKKLNKTAFNDDAYFELYACRMGSTVGGAVNFAQTLANWTGKDVKATYSGFGTAGRTEYSDTLGISQKEYNVLYYYYLLAGQSSILEYLNELLQKSNERETASQGKPYPALFLPRPASSIIPGKEFNPHWVVYSPEV